MGQVIPKVMRIMKQPSIYDMSVSARRHRDDFAALQLSEDQISLMWKEFCKVGSGGSF